jgi:hypothetical protein
MSQYYSSKCDDGDKLVKSRCECKKTIKIKLKRKRAKVRITVKKKKPKVKKKTVKKKKPKVKKKTVKKEVKNNTKNDKYEEHWALKPGQYSQRKPTNAQLKIRRKRIDQLYKLYEKLKKLDKNTTHPSEWQYPPEYCYNLQLQHAIKNIKGDIKYLEDRNKKKYTAKRKAKRKRCPNGTKKDPKTQKCISKTKNSPNRPYLPTSPSYSPNRPYLPTSPSYSPIRSSEINVQSAVIENNTPKIAKELRVGQKKGIKYSPSINKQLMTLKTLTPRDNIYDCPNGGIFAKTQKGSKCYGWNTKKARGVMLANLNTKKPVIANDIIAPAQHQSNCWMNSFFVTWFLSDKGRKFNRWFRQTAITGELPDKTKIPTKFKKPAFLLNKMIDASLRGGKNDISRYAELMDTNDIIRAFHRAAPKSRIVKTKRASNPLTFYSTIYRQITNTSSNEAERKSWGNASLTKGPLSWLNISITSKVTVSNVKKYITEISNKNQYIPNIIFIEIFETPAKTFKTPKNITTQIGNKKVKYSLDAAVLRNTSKIHFSAYATINGKDYGFDGESYSRLQLFDWKSKLNVDTKWRFAEQYETYFNFTKGYQLLIYYRN